MVLGWWESFKSKSPHPFWFSQAPCAPFHTLPSKYGRISPYCCRGDRSRGGESRSPPATVWVRNMREIDVPLTRQAVVCTSCLIRLVRSFALRYGELAPDIHDWQLPGHEELRKSSFGAPKPDFRTFSPLPRNMVLILVATSS